MSGKLCRTGGLRAVVAGSILLAGALAAQAQPAYLVKDLDSSAPSPVSRFPQTQAALGGFVYFSAQDPQHGIELWRTDGTASGTELFLDLCPGSCGSQPYNLIVLQGRLFFQADDGVHGREPWVSDGTRAGTHLLLDVCPGACRSVYDLGVPWIVETAGSFLFTARDGTTTGLELWRTDGTSAGTSRVATDLTPLYGYVTPFAGQAYYAAADADGGEQLVRSDGTPGGTVGVPIRCAAPCPYPLENVVATDRYLLVVDRNLKPAAAWTVDRSGVVQPFSLPCVGACDLWEGVAVPGGAYVVAGPVTAETLWWTDLAPGGTAVRLHDFPEPPLSLTPVGSRLFFFAGPLWVSDGTPQGTLSPSPVYGHSMAPFGSGVIFSGQSFGGPVPFPDEELWVSDGTAEGTRLLELDPRATSQPIPRYFVPLRAQELFVAYQNPGGDRVWRSDGTAGGTTVVQGPILAPGSSSPSGLAPLAGSLYFTAAPSDHQAAGLFRSDGTAAGTVRLHNASTLLAPALFGGRLFFSDTAYAGFPGSYPGLFVSADVAADGFVLQVGGSYPRQLTPVGSDLFYLAGTETYDINSFLFFLPAGADQARLVAVNDTSREAPIPGAAHDLTPLGGRVLLGGIDATHGDELWLSDGTAAGTALLADLCSGTCSSRPSHFLPMGSFALFATASDQQGAGLWRTDGTAAGTLRLAAFPGNPELGGAGPREPVLLSGRAYFLVTLPGSDELWTSDGTAAGTRRVSALGLDGSPARARHLVTAGRLLYFAVYHETTGEELWASDGTALGTHLVADLNPGPASGAPQNLSAQGDRLFFSATDGASGFEPWTSDGTPLGTYRLADVAPGPDSSNPAGFTLAGDRLFWSADDGAHGRELWAIPSAALTSPLCRTDDATLCLLGRFAVTLTWKANGAQGAGHAVGRSNESGLFWFFDPDNPEILVKLLNGSGVNGSYWFFSGALSDVAYRVTVKDLATGLARTYDNPRGRLCGQADTAAFPAPRSAEVSAASAASAGISSLLPAAGPQSGTCQGGSQTLCLANGRFKVEAAFAPDRTGAVREPATALPAGDRSGFFWFFDGGNLELAVKLVDGTALNGHTWFFYGALSDVAYTITVTDTVSATSKTYRNSPGNLCGGGDTATF